MAYFIHDVPGRLRVRTPAVQRDRVKGAAAAALIRAVAGVRSVRVTAATGSITVHYCGHLLCPSQLINLLVRHGYLTGIIGFPRRLRPSPVHRRWL